MNDLANGHQPDGHAPSPMSIRYFLLVFLLSLFFFGLVLWPFWSILVLSFLLTNLFRPIYIFINRKVPEKAASVLTCLLIIAIVFIPLIFFRFFSSG